MTYVPSSTAAVEVLRKDLGSRIFYLVDIGLTPKLVKTLNMKAKTRQSVVVIDHHQQTEHYLSELEPHARVVVDQQGSAASVAHRHWGGLPAFDHLSAIADKVEYCASPSLARAIELYGEQRIGDEATLLDFAWRLQIDDDRFRLSAARRLAQGFWPSEIDEVKRRYLQVVNEHRWDKAIDRVRSKVVCDNGIAVLSFGRRKPSLLGFGSRALTSVAAQQGCRIAVLINRRREMSSIALRGIGEPPVNLGRFAEEFTLEHGVVGGGHPASAGAKIHTRDVPLFMEMLAEAV
ncbi:MAG TPA: hypothetical protein VM681_00180 [Candidatus Thermoplasmatota archaeon]|nr:hypothetical protein [Candidatus Thermoplasmatota archaeon]